MRISSITLLVALSITASSIFAAAVTAPKAAYNKAATSSKLGFTTGFSFRHHEQFFGGLDTRFRNYEVGFTMALKQVTDHKGTGTDKKRDSSVWLNTHFGMIFPLHGATEASLGLDYGHYWRGDKMDTIDHPENNIALYSGLSHNLSEKTRIFVRLHMLDYINEGLNESYATESKAHNYVQVMSTGSIGMTYYSY